MIRRLLCTTALALLATSAGCASKQAAPTSRPSEIGTTERQREMARTNKGPAGWLKAGWLQTTWWFDDFSDTITGAPAKYARQTVDPRNDAETRRQGIVGLAERPAGLGPQYAVVYADIAQKPNDPLLRATAIRALNRARDPRFTTLFVDNLKDPNDLVRLEACKGLNRVPDVKAVPGLLAIAAKPDENKDVRIAATEALRHYKRTDAARALAGLLADRDFSIVWQARRSLADLTQKDFGYDQGAWLNYLTKPDKPLM